MNTGRFFNIWTLLAIGLVAIIIAGGIIIGTRYHPQPGIEISIVPEEPPQGNIFLGGEVNNPGIYPVRAGDSLEDVLRAAGGLKDGIERTNIQLIVSGNEMETPQKININRAEAWLLESLPGVGEARAQAIVEYRQQHGLFRDIHELTSVPGLGETIFEDIKDMITVAD